MEAPIAEIKPNVKKAFLLNVLVIVGIVFLAVAMLIYLHIMVGLGLFLDVLRLLGVIISPLALLMYSILIIIFITVLSLILNYVILGKISYTFYPDKMVYNRSLFIIEIRDKAIPYANITKISYEKKPFLNTSKITFELTGMKEKTVMLDFLDDVEDVVKNIQRWIREYRSRYYARYTQEYRMQNIMEDL